MELSIKKKSPTFAMMNAKLYTDLPCFSNMVNADEVTVLLVDVKHSTDLSLCGMLVRVGRSMWMVCELVHVLSFILKVIGQIYVLNMCCGCCNTSPSSYNSTFPLSRIFNLIC